MLDGKMKERVVVAKRKKAVDGGFTNSNSIPKPLYNLFVLFFIFASLFTYAGCGSNFFGGGGNKKEEQPKISPEVQSALELIYSIDAENDSLDDVIKTYKSARDKISAKQQQLKQQGKDLTIEEKYILFITDTMWSLHKLIKLINILLGAFISGNFDQNTLTEIIKNLSPYLNLSPETSQRLSYTQINDVSSLPYDCSSTTGISQVLCSAIQSVLLGKIEQNIKTLREIQASGADFKVNIRSLPIKVQLVVLKYYIDFGGEHDLGLTYFFDSILSFVDALFRFVFSINLDLLYGVLDVPKYLGSVSITSDPLLHIGRILTYLLINNRAAFGVASVLELERSKYQLSQSLEKTINFIDYTLTKNVDTKQDILYFDSAEEKLKIRYKYNDEERDVEVLKKSDVEIFKSKVQKFLSNLQGQGGEISLSKDVVFVVSALLVGVIKSGIFDAILDTALALLGSQNNQLVGTLKQLLNSDLFQPSTVSGLLGSILGDVIYFDFGLMFSNLKEGKTKLREWLPAWTTSFAVDSNLDTQKKFRNNFIIEWDCGAKIYSEDITITSETYQRTELFGLSCTSPQTDISHFPAQLTEYGISITAERVQNWTAGSWEIPPDGVPFKFPYILFQDPSFGGLLLINKGGFTAVAGNYAQNIQSFLDSCGVQSGIQNYYNNRKAGVCALNAYLQLVIDKVLGIAGGAGG